MTSLSQGSGPGKRMLTVGEVDMAANILSCRLPNPLYIQNVQFFHIHYRRFQWQQHKQALLRMRVFVALT